MGPLAGHYLSVCESEAVFLRLQLNPVETIAYIMGTAIDNVRSYFNRAKHRVGARDLIHLFIIAQRDYDMEYDRWYRIKHRRWETNVP